MKPEEAVQILEFEKSKRDLSRFMSPKQRVNKAIAHEPIDLVPFDIWASPDQWKKIKNGLNVKSVEAVLDLLDVDCRIIAPEYVGPAPIRLENGTYIDALGSLRCIKKTQFGSHKELIGYPLKNARTAVEVETYEYMPKPEYWDCKSVLGQIASLGKKNQYHIRFETCGIFEYSWALIGLEKFLMCMADGNMEVPNTVMSIITELFTKITNQILSEANGKVDMVYIYDDIGTQNGPMMSVAMWKKYILPWYKKFLASFQSYPVQLMYHSCGSVKPFIPHLISELGIDVLNPLQPKAAKMDFKVLKSEFGDRLAFHGGIDTQELLPFANPLFVQENVIKAYEILGKNGGYICAPAHKLQADVPLENVVAMYTTPRKVVAL